MPFWRKSVTKKPKIVNPKKAKMDESKALMAVEDYLRKSMQTEKGAEGHAMPLRPLQQSQLVVVQKRGPEVVNELKERLTIEFQTNGLKANPSKVLADFVKELVTKKK